MVILMIALQKYSKCMLMQEEILSLSYTAANKKRAYEMIAFSDGLLIQGTITLQLEYMKPVVTASIKLAGIECYL